MLLTGPLDPEPLTGTLDPVGTPKRLPFSKQLQLVLQLAPEINPGLKALQFLGEHVTEPLGGAVAVGLSKLGVPTTPAAFAGGVVEQLPWFLAKPGALAEELMQSVARRKLAGQMALRQLQQAGARQAGQRVFSSLQRQGRALLKQASKVPSAVPSLPRVSTTLPARTLNEGAVGRTFAGFSPKETARLIGREEMAKAELERAQVAERLSQARNEWRTQPAAQGYAFMRAIAKGEPPLDPKRLELWTALRKIHDTDFQQLVAEDPSFAEHWIAHYFPQTSKKAGATKQIIESVLSRRPLVGPASFRKPRVFKDFWDNLEQLRATYGLEPVTSNPVEMSLLKHEEVQKFLTGRRIMDKLRAEGYLRKFSSHARVPEDWVKLDNRLVSRHPLAPPLFAPVDVARYLNNYASPGLAPFPIFQGIRKSTATVNMMEMGLSAFHARHEIRLLMANELAVGARRFLQGDLTAAFTTLPKTLAAPVWRTLQGRKFQQELLAAGTQGNTWAKFYTLYTKSGGRLGWERFYQNSATANLFEAIRQGSLLQSSWRVPLAGMEQLSKLTMGKLVPWIKTGAWISEAERLMAQEGATLSEGALAQQLARLGDTVDDRFGLLVKDNLPWRQGLKDGLYITVRFLGWNFGTGRGMAKGVADLVRARPTTEALILFTYPLLTMLEGGAVQYLHTGVWPRTLGEYFYPYRDLGRKLRISFPGYQNNVRSFWRDKARFLMGALNPGIQLFADFVQGHGYDQVPLYLPKGAHQSELAHKLEELRQIAEHLGTLYVPFVETSREQGIDPLSAFLGERRAPKWMTQTLPARAKLRAQLLARQQHSPSSLQRLERFLGLPPVTR